ncbi:MAG: O-methyltransferase [Actinomycetota bacterium]|nr:O-methyltransferase [Actinomycetota bacterium]
MEIDQRVLRYVQAYTEPEDEPLRAARARSEEADVPAVAVETGALLRLFARLVSARHVVEVGSGGGYSGLWLIGGMDRRGSLTTIEIERDHQLLAQQAFLEARVADRVRSMLGPALSVLPKLADGNYDLVFLDAVKAEYLDYLGHARRLLRPGGLLLADNVLWRGRVADESVVDDATQGLRAFNDAVRDDPAWRGMILPVGDGVLAAVHTP